MELIGVFTIQVNNKKEARLVVYERTWFVIFEGLCLSANFVYPSPQFS